MENKELENLIIMEGMENTKEASIETTIEDITGTIPMRETETTEGETIQSDLQHLLNATRIILPIIISTLLLIFVVLFTDKILYKMNNKSKGRLKNEN